MSPEELERVIRQYQQLLADAQMHAATLSAQLVTSQEQNATSARIIAELEAKAAPKSGAANA